METEFQWTVVWEQTHSTEEEDVVRAQLQDGFDSGALIVCPHCRAMEARISTNPSNNRFHAFIACTCQLSDPRKLDAQAVDGTIPSGSCDR